MLLRYTRPFPEFFKVLIHIKTNSSCEGCIIYNVNVVVLKFNVTPELKEISVHFNVLN